MSRQLHIIAAGAAIVFSAQTPLSASTPVTIVVPLEFKHLDAKIVSARVSCATFADPLTPAERADRASLAQAFDKKPGRSEFPTAAAPIVNGKAIPETISFSYKVPVTGHVPSSFICAIRSFVRSDGTEVGVNAKPIEAGAPFVSVVGGEFPPPRP